MLTWWKSHHILHPKVDDRAFFDFCKGRFIVSNVSPHTFELRREGSAIGWPLFLWMCRCDGGGGRLNMDAHFPQMYGSKNRVKGRSRQ